MSEVDQSILEALSEARRPLGPKEIARRKDLDYGYVRKRIRDLDDRGYVTGLSGGKYVPADDRPGTASIPVLSRDGTAPHDLQIDRRLTAGLPRRARLVAARVEGESGGPWIGDRQWVLAHMTGTMSGARYYLVFEPPVVGEEGHFRAAYLRPHDGTVAEVEASGTVVPWTAARRDAPGGQPRFRWRRPLETESTQETLPPNGSSPERLPPKRVHGGEKVGSEPASDGGDRDAESSIEIYGPVVGTLLGPSVIGRIAGPMQAGRSPSPTDPTDKKDG
jgi:hypothetical protein